MRLIDITKLDPNFLPYIQPYLYHELHGSEKANKTVT